RERWTTVALYLNAALLVAVLIVLLGRDNAPRILPAALGQNQLPIGGGAGVFIVPAQFSVSTYGCYLMDIDAQTLCAYEFFPGDKQLRLIAARNFRYDRRLGNFNTEKPTPAEVKQLVDQEQENSRVLQNNTQKSSPEAPQKQE
ncbi:MAG TPA: hypothetical protein VKK61_07585, partial [Tepidisphaeraceae bacterium]|nr:hypothetical protein [Tepidisphaeraceae bacterium]